jgi:hypothetical protein
MVPPPIFAIERARREQEAARREAWGWRGGWMGMGWMATRSGQETFMGATLTTGNECGSDGWRGCCVDGMDEI